jgi:hypothetical protein
MVTGSKFHMNTHMPEQPVNFTVIWHLQLGTCELMHICIWGEGEGEGEGEGGEVRERERETTTTTTCNNNAGNLRHCHTKFSGLCNQVPDVCIPLMYNINKEIG